MSVPATTAATEPIEPDPIRDRLLDAAVKVFARNGYAGTKIMDIVRESGLSTGAVYGRFESKNELLREAVIRRSRRLLRVGSGIDKVGELIARMGQRTSGSLHDDEAARLEAYVTARREPMVAAALAQAQDAWRISVQPLVDAAVADGTVAPDVDPEAVLFFVQTMHLGLLLQRAAGTNAPEPDGWRDLLHRVIASFGTTDPAFDAEKGLRA